MRYQVKAVEMDAQSRTTEREIIEVVDPDEPLSSYAGCRKESPANCLLIEKIYEALANQYRSDQVVVKVIDVRLLD